ncbi:MAG TPA: TMEM165/GDT1 family protein [Steroidobacteraceae bacterium]|nr:TMEM165/GDT1 family protein [Steroidobacteraceae bacterium]HRX90941.1 TMEM165/GDT1 family protein [Steroidobacteraceae bacterium]
MDLKTFALVFGSVFLAELGDKTQLATMLFAARGTMTPLGVFLAAASALIVASAIGVLAGAWVARYIDTRYLTMIAGAGFIAIGLWTLWTALRSGA